MEEDYELVRKLKLRCTCSTVLHSPTPASSAQTSPAHAS